MHKILLISLSFIIGLYAIEIPIEKDGKADTLLFQKGLMPGKPQDFYQIVHLSRDYIVVKQLLCLVNERTLSTIGEVSYERKFMPRYLYYLVTQGRGHPVKPGSAKVWSLLDRRKEAQEYVKEHNLRITTEADWLEVFRYLDSL